jgi:hypothetical protein
MRKLPLHQLLLDSVAALDGSVRRSKGELLVQVKANGTDLREAIPLSSLTQASGEELPLALLSALRHAVSQRHGTIHAVEVASPLFTELPRSGYPVLLCWFHIEIFSALPREFSLGIAVPGDNLPCIPVSAADACEMIPAIRRAPVPQRVPLSDLLQRESRARLRMADEIRRFREECETQLLTVRSRQRRQVEEVFRQRWDDAGEGGDKEKSDIQRDWNDALANVEQRFSPESMTVTVDMAWAAWLQMPQRVVSHRKGRRP